MAKVRLPPPFTTRSLLSVVLSSSVMRAFRSRPALTSNSRHLAFRPSHPSLLAQFAFSAANEALRLATLRGSVTKARSMRHES